MSSNSCVKFNLIRRTDESRLLRNHCISLAIKPYALQLLQLVVTVQYDRDTTCPYSRLHIAIGTVEIMCSVCEITDREIIVPAITVHAFLRSSKFALKDFTCGDI